jgi:hypothetical protein
MIHFLNDNRLSQQCIVLFHQNPVIIHCLCFYIGLIFSSFSHNIFQKYASCIELSNKSLFYTRPVQILKRKATSLELRVDTALQVCRTCRKETNVKNNDIIHQVLGESPTTRTRTRTRQKSQPLYYVHHSPLRYAAIKDHVNRSAFHHNAKFTPTVNTLF